VYADRAASYAALGMYNEALQDFQRSITHDEENVLAIYQRGTTYLRLNEAHKALQDFNYVLAHEPNFARAYAQRAEAHLRLGNLVQARVDYRQSWELDSTHIEPAWMGAWLDMCLDDYPGAISPETLEEIASRDPADYHACLCRAVAHLLREQPERALSELAGAYNLDSQHWGALFWFTMAWGAMHLDEEAFSALDHAILDARLPLPLLAPLRWFRYSRPEFYNGRLLPLLKQW
jgi:tetratricopeptide (TPR) repeat protein